ncbi:hypothetical protein L2E82_26463 [Cichorium intybus]|uniref:Uncharacterized protein n=1 Tax=Cichorium intybus TaxID=13427 RepID=A0ACB9CQS6_CICIN|nr:hypothetical protein L2E82_26463 [Cichorium intybus]
MTPAAVTTVIVKLGFPRQRTGFEGLFHLFVGPNQFHHRNQEAAMGSKVIRYYLNAIVSTKPEMGSLASKLEDCNLGRISKIPRKKGKRTQTCGCKLVITSLLLTPLKLTHLLHLPFLVSSCVSKPIETRRNQDSD